MCLAIPYADKATRKFPEPLIAAEDIRVFKALDVTPTDDGEQYVSPYQSEIYELGEEKRVVMGLYHVRATERDYNGEEAKVSEGLHAFGSPAGIAAARAACNNTNERDFVVFEAIIPKGSKYYVGVFENIPDAYVSDTLIVTKRYKEA